VTAPGRDVVNRQRLGLLRARASAARRAALATAARAEALYTFADDLARPGATLLCMPPRRRRALTFGELASIMRQSVGRYVLVTTDAGRVWPQVAPIIAVGAISSVEEERGLAVEDWQVNLSLEDVAFIAFSRRHFQSAEEDAAMGEIYVQQAAETIVVSFQVS
jgi:hypothetical protein